MRHVAKQTFIRNTSINVGLFADPDSLDGSKETLLPSYKSKQNKDTAGCKQTSEYQDTERGKVMTNECVLR